MKRVLTRLRLLAGLGLIALAMSISGCAYYPYHGGGHIGYHDGHLGYGGHFRYRHGYPYHRGHYYYRHHGHHGFHHW